MVARRHHHQRGHDRVGGHEHPQQPVPDHRVQRQRAPDRPGHVQARHRRVLVARRSDQGGLGMPGSRVPQRVRDPEAARQQPGRRHRIQPEADEPHRRRHRQRRARPGVPLGMAQQQPAKRDGRNQEVGAPVVQVERVRDGIPPDERRLHGLLMEQPEKPLSRDDRQRMAARRPARLHHVLADVLVHRRQHHHQHQFPGHPPPAAPARHPMPAAAPSAPTADAPRRPCHVHAPSPPG